MFKEVSFINAGAVTGKGFFNTALIISIMPGGEGSAVGSVLIPFGGQPVAVAETPDYFVPSDRPKANINSGAMKMPETQSSPETLPDTAAATSGEIPTTTEPVPPVEATASSTEASSNKRR